MEERVMPFGKYKGQSIEEVINKHPFYMKWVMGKTNLDLTDNEKEKISANSIARSLSCIGRKIKYNGVRIHQSYNVYDEPEDDRYLGANPHTPLY